MSVSWILAWQISVVIEPVSKIPSPVLLFFCFCLSNLDKSQCKTSLNVSIGAFLLAFLQYTYSFLGGLREAAHELVLWRKGTMEGERW